MHEPVKADEDLAGEREFSVSKRRLQLYVAIVLLLPGLFLASSIPIVCSDSFPGESIDPFVKYSDYPFSFKHENCEVVIFGDSTAATGIDPTVIEEITGLKSCSIAESQSIIEILGFYALDTYLRNNSPPQYVIMQFSPEVLTRDKDIFWAEGLTLLFRKKSVFAALPIVAQHPIEFYNFAIWAIKTKFLAINGPSRSDFADMEAIFRARHGLIILPKPPETGCVRHSTPASPSEAWVRWIRDTYSKNGARVVVDVAPVPECTQNVQHMTDEFRNVTDNVLPILPINLFCDLDRHLTLEGAKRSSAQIGEQILALARQ